MSAPILSRLAKKWVGFELSTVCRICDARHARQIGRQSLATSRRMAGRHGLKRNLSTLRVSHLFCATRATRPLAVLSRCLFFPLGKRQTRQTGCIGSF